jgi:hypothetical protein
MHHNGTTENRRWLVERWGTQLANAARVPRIFQCGDRIYRHHVRVVITADHTQICAQLVDERALND